MLHRNLIESSRGYDLLLDDGVRWWVRNQAGKFIFTTFDEAEARKKFRLFTQRP